MKYQFVLSLALLGATACTVPSGDEATDLESSADALGRGGFHGGRGAVRNFGGGGACKFDDDGRGPADSFVIANGADVSIVFTKLGDATRRAPGGLVQSRCNFAVPLDVPAGSYISGWKQSLTYGIVKPAGVRAGLGLDSAIDRAGNGFPGGTGLPGRPGGGPGFGPGRGMGGGMFQLPGIAVAFDKLPELNIPLAVATPAVDGFDETDPRYNFWRSRWCATARAGDLQFVGSAYTWTERTAPDATPVIIAIDGLDAKFDLGIVAQTCPVGDPGGGAGGGPITPRPGPGGGGPGGGFPGGPHGGGPGRR